MNPYQVLGVTESATQDEIKSAYRKLARKYHPDLNPGNKDNENKIKEVNQAYDLIGTPEAREKYKKEKEQEAAYQQQTRENAQWNQGPFYHQTQGPQSRYNYSYTSGGGGFHPEDFGDIFGNVDFSDYMRQRSEATRNRAKDKHYGLKISFKEAALGADKEVTLPDQRKVAIKIPPGVVSGSKLRVAGLGDKSADGKNVGSAFIDIEVQESPIFKRTGLDVYLDLPISTAEALLGAEVRVPTVDGFVQMKIQPCVSSGAKLRLKGKGIKSGTHRGDQYVILQIKNPMTISPEFQAQVEKWKSESAFDARSGWDGYKEASV